MPRTRSYHNHHPALTVEYSASTLSRWGFLPAILRYLQRLELPQRLRGVTIPSAPKAHFKPGDKLMTLVTVFGSWGQIRAQALDGRDRRRSPGGRYTLLHGARTHGFPLEGLHGRGCVLPQTRRVTPPRRAGLSEV